MNLFKRKKTYYEILGVSESASQQEIEDAFREIDENYNPEKVPNLSDKKIIAFFKAKEAYKTLSDVSKRKEYDRNLFDDVDTFDYEDEKHDVGASDYKDEKQDVDAHDHEDEKHDANKISELNCNQTSENNQSKLTIFPKAKEFLRKNKNRLIAGGLVFASLAAGYRLGKVVFAEETKTSVTEEQDNEQNQQPIEESKLLTAENIDEKVQEILEDNKTRGLNIDPTFIKSALFITNIDYLDQEDIKKMWENGDLNIIEEIQNMYNYTSAVGTHNNNVVLGQEQGQYIALSNLAFDAEDKTILRELDQEFVDLVNDLKNKNMTAEQFQASFKYITEFYTGKSPVVTNGVEYNNYSLTAGAGLLSEQYWPMFSVNYANSEFITKENMIDIKTLSQGTEEQPAVINGSKYLGSIVNHESLQCLEETQELESEKTLTKTQ